MFNYDNNFFLMLQDIFTNKILLRGGGGRYLGLFPGDN